MGATAEAALLAPSEDEGIDPHRLSPPPHPQASHPLGAMELVRREARQVSPEGVDIDRHSPQGLGRIDMEEPAAGPDHRRNRAHVLNDPDLVVGQEHRNEKRVAVPRCVDRGRIDPPG